MYENVAASRGYHKSKLAQSVAQVRHLQIAPGRNQHAEFTSAPIFIVSRFLDLNSVMMTSEWKYSTIHKEAKKETAGFSQGLNLLGGILTIATEVGAYQSITNMC